MPKLLISFNHTNARLSGSRWIFPTRRRMRFEWLALLALKRLTLSGEQAWVNLAEIARLPSWRGKNKHSVTTNIGRYLQSLERTGLNLVSAEANWAGPYRLNVGALSIKFDIPLAEVIKRLRLGAAVAKIGEREVKMGIQPEFIEFMNRMIPLGRGGTPEEAAGAVYLMCIPESDYISGELVLASGGFVM